VRVIQATEPAHLEAALALRFAVFVDEQGVSPEGERDALDRAPDTVHFLALSGEGPSLGGPGDVVGVGRLLGPRADGHPHIGRVAIARDRRRSGVGRALMDAIEREALARFGQGGAVTVALSAQVQAIPFYEAIGYVIVGEPYLDEGIWHRDGTKVVSAPEAGA
jgi:predicted GNAT family N-acyltransferase